MRSASFITLLVGILGVSLVPRAILAQGVTVRGTVVERTQSSWIGGAIVRLSGSPPYLTDLDGGFEFTGVTRGRHTLTVEAMGYRAPPLEVMIRGDTVLLVEMDPDPILLDSLLVRAGEITIRGTVVDARTGQTVLYADVTVSPELPSMGAISGSFTIRKVPVGRVVTLLVEAVEYRPARIALITDADTTLTIELEPDPVGIRMVAEQVKKLEARSQAVPYIRTVTNAEDLARYPGWTIFDVVDLLLKTSGRRGAGLSPQSRLDCLFIDDVRRGFASFLYGLTAGEVERVEIYDGGGMIRVYTKRYLFGLLGREPEPIVYKTGGLISMGKVCR